MINVCLNNRLWITVHLTVHSVSCFLFSNTLLQFTGNYEEHDTGLEGYVKVSRRLLVPKRWMCQESKVRNGSRVRRALL